MAGFCRAISAGWRGRAVPSDRLDRQCRTRSTRAQSGFGGVGAAPHRRHRGGAGAGPAGAGFGDGQPPRPLRRIAGYLRRLGFDAVAFSYPQREPFGSSSLVYSADSSLVDLGRDELLAALEAIRRLRKQFPVLNPPRSPKSRAMCAASGRRFRALAAINISISTGTLDDLALRGLEPAARFGFRSGAHPRPARAVQRLHDGLLPQYQRADACRRRGGRCGTGPRRGPYRRCGGIAVPARRGAIAAGSGRGAAANAARGAPPQTYRGQSRGYRAFEPASCRIERDRDQAANG